MKSITWCISIIVTILLCSTTYAAQTTIVSFDDLPDKPLLTEAAQLKSANNDNTTYNDIVWDDGISIFGKSYKICEECPLFGKPRSGNYAITNYNVNNITLITSKILLGFWVGQNEYYGYGGGSNNITVHALDVNGNTLKSIALTLPDNLPQEAEPLSYIDTSVFTNFSGIQSYRIESNQSCVSGCNWVADDFTFIEKGVVNDEKFYTQAELDAKYEEGKKYCIDNPEKCGITSSVVDGCAILENNLDITMPCINVFGTKIPIGLEQFTNKDDPLGYYWKLNL